MAPPRQVAAPPKGSISVGWLWVWISKHVIVVTEVDDGIGLFETVLDAQAGGKRAAYTVADNDLEGNDLDLAAKLFIVADGLDVVGLDPVPVEIAQQESGDLVVQCTFPEETRTLDAVVGKGHILVSEDDLIGIVGREDLFLVAVENQFVFLHVSICF